MIEQFHLGREADCPWEADKDDPGVRWRQLVSGDRTPSCGITQGVCEVAPGSELAPHHHAPQEVYYAIEGRAEIYRHGAWHPIEKGDMAYIPGGTTHGLRNRGSEPFVLVWTFPTDTFAEIEYVDG